MFSDEIIMIGTNYVLLFPIVTGYIDILTEIRDTNKSIWTYGVTEKKIYVSCVMIIGINTHVVLDSCARCTGYSTTNKNS